MCVCVLVCRPDLSKHANEYVCVSMYTPNLSMNAFLSTCKCVLVCMPNLSMHASLCVLLVFTPNLSMHASVCVCALVGTGLTCPCMLVNVCVSM